MILNYNLSLLLLTSAQTVASIRNEQYPPTTVDGITSSTTGSPNSVNTTSKPIQRTQQQTKSLKFTLVAGKFWRFDIKANSFSTYKEGELRLHKNVSANNFTIDDDGWFQYNHQQQQLFAWPSLTTKPGIYNYVLLPSKIDLEEESENTINVEVVASIIVELIRPLYPVNKSDIDQLIDHKFLLNDLRRHSSYPLLLQQIVSVFEFVAAKPQNSTTNTASGLFASGTGSISNHQKNKLSEYLLISSDYSADGELFSLVWSTHPSLINNTVTQISKCRLTAIRDTVAKLSISSNGQLKDDDKSVVYYSIAAPFLNSQAIVPNLRGNTVLKLVLNGPCKNETVIEELGILGFNKSNDNVDWGADDKENSVVSEQAASKKRLATVPPSLPDPEAIDSNTAAQTSTTSAPLIPISTTSVSTLQVSSLPGTDAPNSSVSTRIVNPKTTTAPISDLAVTELGTEDSAKITETACRDIDCKDLLVNNQSENVTPNSSSATEPTKISFVKEVGTSTERTTDEAVVVTKLSKTEGPLVVQQQPKIQPKAKSLVEFLDSSDKPNQTMATSTPENTSNMTRVLDSTNSSQSVIMVPTSDPNVVTESTLNEDLMGILDDVMNYLISVAVPVSIVIGAILLISILIAIWSLCVKRRQSKEFQVRNRFDFRYGSERRVFLKNSSKPVILDADQKSLSMGGTPQHKPAKKPAKKKSDTSRVDFLPLNSFDPGFASGGGTSGIVSGGGCDTGFGHAGGGCDVGGFGGGDCGGGDFG